MKSAAVYNILTVLMLGMTALMCLWTAALFVNPNIPLNPLPPRSPTSVPALATFTPPAATPASAEPTATARLQATLTPGITKPSIAATPGPAATTPMPVVGTPGTPTDTPTAAPSPTPTRTATPTATSLLPSPTPFPEGYPPPIPTLIPTGYPP